MVKQFLQIYLVVECTITADSDSSAASSFKETLCKLDTDTKGIETTLHQIASGLQSATEGYLTLASHISGIAPYELPQIIADTPSSYGCSYACQKSINGGWRK